MSHKDTQERVYRLRLDGIKVKDIAQAVGLSVRRVQQILHPGKKRVKPRVQKTFTPNPDMEGGEYAD